LAPIFLALPLVASVVTALGLALALKRFRLPLDQPNERSLHSIPTPRSGGLVATPIVLALWITLYASIPWLVWTAGALLFVISALDDVRSLPVAARFACHLIAAAMATLGALPEHASLVSIVVATLAIAWMINLYNFMDGSDGLAGGMTVIGFGTYGVAAWLGADPPIAIAAWILSGAAAGFLVWNFPPARVFLGDSGSITFGGMAGALGVLGWARELWPIWFPILVFSPFIVDASVTLARRSLRGEKVWQAHREHYYQRLVQLGWGHRRTAVAEYTLMVICSGTALVGLQLETSLQVGLLMANATVLTILMTLVDRAWRRQAVEV